MKLLNFFIILFIGTAFLCASFEFRQEELQWMSQYPQYLEKMDYPISWVLVFISMLIIIAVMFLNRRLLEEIGKREKLHTELEYKNRQTEHYLDIAQVLIMALDEKKNVIMINQKGADLLGYTKEEIIGKNWVENFLPASVKEEIHKVGDDIIEEKEEHTGHENAVLTKSGEERLLVWKNSSLLDEDGNSIGILTSGEDITEKRASEILNEKLKERMEFVHLSSNDGVWDWNLSDNSLYYSPRWKEMLGYADNELSNEFLSWETLVHADDLEKTRKDFQSHIDGKTDYYKNTHRLKHKDGHWVWIMARGKIFFDKSAESKRFVGTHTDITKEKQRQVEFSQQAQMIQQIHDSVISTDLEGKIISWNNGSQILLGYSAQEMIGRNISDLCYKEELYNLMEIGAPIVINEGAYTCETRLVHKSKEIIFVNISLSLLLDERGNPTKIVGYAQDITRAKEVEKELQEQQKQLLLQSRQAQMGEMISMIAHQWRQPLSSISATVSFLQLKQALGECEEGVLNEKLQNIESYTQHLSKTINDFRDFFKEDKKPTNIRLSELIDGAIDIIKPIFVSKGIVLRVEHLSDEKISTYPNELKQVILNILKNAQEVLEEKKVENTKIELKTYKEDDTYYISIEDNAGGIPSDIIEKIFDPYFTTKGECNGTGLGLYMSKIIVQKHCKGNIEVKNTQDGARFLISLKKSIE